MCGTDLTIGDVSNSAGLLSCDMLCFAWQPVIGHNYVKWVDTMSTICGLGLKHDHTKIVRDFIRRDKPSDIQVDEADFNMD